MELVIEGDTSVGVEGTVTVELPSYMVTLPQEELTEARVANNRSTLILACGIHPTSGDLVFITGSGVIAEIELGTVSLPALSHANPIDYGQTIKIDFVDDSKFDSIEVSSTWTLRVAHTLIDVGSLVDKRGAKVQYLDE